MLVFTCAGAPREKTTTMKTVTIAAVCLLLAATGTSFAKGDATGCLMQCDTTRLTCNQKDPRTPRCGQEAGECREACTADPNAAPRTSHFASCDQHCEDAAEQCGIANHEAQACRDGRDACIERCGGKPVSRRPPASVPSASR